MHCPTCTTTPLVLAQRQNVEVDYCPHCRGVWLDRGELEKLFEHAAERQAEPKTGRFSKKNVSIASPQYRHPQRQRSSWLSDLLN
ncbi:MAG: zf-TFIIB domain-containing protein [Polaromonas sp.]|nr:zf-TFIIB domain-containing protein [Polaromonas sp.]